MLLSDADIVRRRSDGDLVIDPWVETSPAGAISYGLTSAGYDIRLADEYKVFTNVACSIDAPRLVNPKNFDSSNFYDFVGPTCVIPPNSFALGRSLERLRIPRDVLGVCLGKSTYARCGILACCTPLEPEWEGYITVEISNTTPCPAVVFSGEGIMQVLFLQQLTVCVRSYADKKGRYQNQVGITLPFVS